MRQNLLKNLLAVFLIVMSTGLAMSQGVTTSGITGTVTEANGQALPGANVVATHLPSGTRYGAVSNVEGKYSIPGMRIGGPYRLSVSFIGFSTQDVDGLILSLGTFSNVNVTLKEDGQELSEVLITANQNGLFSKIATPILLFIFNKTS